MQSVAVNVLPEQSTDLLDRASWLKHFVASRCPSYLYDQRDDICQEAMMRLMRAEQRKGAENINSAYMRQAAMSAIIDAVRRFRCRPIADDQEFEIGTSPNVEPESITERGQVLAMVYRALDSFPARRREILLLYFRGLEISEIVELTQQNQATVRNDIYRGRNRLAECLREQGVDYETG